MSRRISSAFAAILLLFPLSARSQAADLTVFAAASLKNALDDIASRFERRTGRKVALAYAGSSILARQIGQSAPADVFISADPDWMDFLDQNGLIRRETRFNLLGNRIVLVAPANRPAALDLSASALGAALGEGRLAMASTATVPAGKYGKAALESLGLWGIVSGRLAQAENVRAALAFVSRGEAPLGVVYETDAKADAAVAIVARFPAASHPPVIYPAALTTQARSPFAEDFLAALRRPDSGAVFQGQGFTVLVP